MSLANIVGGSLGYIYQIIMGRMLTPADFALFSAILALAAFFSAPLNAIFILLSRHVTVLGTLARENFLQGLYWRSHKYLILGGTIFLLLAGFCTTLLQNYLKSPDWVPIWLFFLILAFNGFLQTNNAFFQGLQRFTLLGGTGVATVFIKILLSTMLIVLGFGINGAIGGVFLSIIVMWLYGMQHIKTVCSEKTGTNQLPIEPFPRNTIFPVFIANIAFIAMTQLDIVLVNHYFTAEEAGKYAAASVLGKAVLYLPGGLVHALFPMVAESHAKQKATNHFLLQAISITTITSGSLVLLYWLIGEWLIDFLYGPSYHGAGELLRLYGFAILPMAFIMVAEFFLIAKGRTLFAWLFLPTAPIQIIAIHLWHTELWMVLATVGTCGVGLMILGYVILWREFAV